MQSDTNSPGSLRIFVVEDHEDTLTIIRRQLEKLGHTVFCASTLNQAVSRLPETNCDVLLTDVGLPDGSGWDLPSLTRLPSTVFTIAMTGRGLDSDRQKSREAGFRHHLVKPYKPSELSDLLAQASAELSAEKASMP